MSGPSEAMLTRLRTLREDRARRQLADAVNRRGEAERAHAVAGRDLAGFRAQRAEREAELQARVVGRAVGVGELWRVRCDLEAIGERDKALARTLAERDAALREAQLEAEAARQRFLGRHARAEAWRTLAERRARRRSRDRERVDEERADEMAATASFARAATEAASDQT